MRASQGIYSGGNQFISNDEIDQSNQSNHCRKQFGQFHVDTYGYTFHQSIKVSCLSRLVEKKGLRPPPPINKFASASII